MKVSKFNDAVVQLLSEKLKKFKESTLDLVTCVEIYTMIFETLTELFDASNVGLSNEAMNYVAQQYYDGVLINDNQELNPNIFTQRAQLESIETKELAMLAVMVSGTEFAIPIIQAIKKRS